MGSARLFTLLASLFCSAAAALAQPVPRKAPAAGSVVSTQFGEEALFVENPVWRNVAVRQDVKSGDVLRTNATGQLAILFADRTQVRVARNSTLVVRETGAGRDTALELQEGSIFARAARGGSGVSVATPAATAAIRGTDWTLTVDGDRTALAVLEGSVEFFNPQGSVTVNAGEAAAATLGGAPSKIVVVNSDTREQMLLNISLRNAFAAVPVTTLKGADYRRERARLAALPVERRTAEDRVLAAEIAFGADGTRAAQADVAAARAVRLSAGQDARLTLVEAGIAGDDGRYAEAARLYARAARGLTGERRGLALTGGYFARALADPSRSEPPPAVGGDAGVIGAYVTTALLQGPKAAYDELKRAAAERETDAVFQGGLAEAAMAAGDYAGAKAAIDRGFAADPAEESLFAVRANYRSGVESDLDGALADIKRAVAAEPGSSDAWNDLGLIQEARGATREAEAAFRRSIALAPRDPVGRANLAVLLLEGNRTEEARAEIDRALADDPAFDIGQLARGRFQLQTGDLDAALDSILRATTVNPGYSNGLLLLAALYATRGENDLATQAIDNADRLDPNDPTVSQYKAIIAIDQFRTDDAIRDALESVRRTRARGGDYASVNATRESGSTVGDAFRFAGLDAWARYYGDVVFDPFLPGSFIDQSLSGGSDVFTLDRRFDAPGPEATADEDAGSALFQGILLDPLAIAGSKRRPNLFRAPFTEAELSAGISTRNGDTGASVAGEVQTLSLGGIPYAAVADLSYDTTDPSFSEQDEENLVGSAIVGAQPAPYDRVVAIAAGARGSGGLGIADQPLRSGDLRDIDAFNASLGWSHTMGYRNVVNAAAFATHRKEESDLGNLAFALTPEIILPASLDSDSRQKTASAGVSHSIDVGPFVLRYGAEGGTQRLESALEYSLLLGGDVPLLQTDTDETRDFGRAYVDALADLTDSVQFEAALFASRLSGEDTRFEPRVALGWQPVEGHWLRAGYTRDSDYTGVQTLSPIGVLRLRANELPLGDDGLTDTAMLRWDAEWSTAFFTAVEYQHQEVDDLSIAVPFSADPFNADEARVDRVSATANAYLGGGVALFGTYALSDTQVESGPFAGRDLPFVPDSSARFGLTYTNPSRLRATLAETYIGTRDDAAAGAALDGFWTTSATLSWETPNRRITADAGLYNIFDEDYEVTDGIPGSGRTATARLGVRF